MIVGLAGCGHLPSACVGRPAFVGRGEAGAAVMAVKKQSAASARNARAFYVVYLNSF